MGNSEKNQRQILLIWSISKVYFEFFRIEPLKNWTNENINTVFYFNKPSNKNIDEKEKNEI